MQSAFIQIVLVIYFVKFQSCDNNKISKMFYLHLQWMSSSQYLEKNNGCVAIKRNQMIDHVFISGNRNGEIYLYMSENIINPLITKANENINSLDMKILYLMRMSYFFNKMERLLTMLFHFGNG